MEYNIRKYILIDIKMYTNMYTYKDWYKDTLVLLGKSWSPGEIIIDGAGLKSSAGSLLTGSDPTVF